MSAAKRHVFEKLLLNGLGGLKVVAGAAQSEEVRVVRVSFDVAHPDRQVESVALRLKGSKHDLQVGGLVALERAIGVLNIEHLEVVVGSVEFLKLGRVNIIFELRDAEVFNLDWVVDRPLQTDGHRWQLVSVLQHLKLGTSVERLAFKPQ